MAKTVKAQLKCRHDTAANWTAKNPVLLDGELGVETDTTFFKIGDGATAWTSLKYVTSKSAVYDSVGRRIDTSYLPLSGGDNDGTARLPGNRQHRKEPGFVLERIDGLGWYLLPDDRIRPRKFSH